MLAKKTILFLLISLFVLSFSVYSTEIDEGAWIRVDQSEEEVVFSGNWSAVETEQAHQGVEMIDFREHSYAEFTFSGTEVRWLGSVGEQRGKADIYINDELVASGVDSYNPETEYQSVIFSKQDLPAGTHTLRIDPVSEGREGVAMTSVAVDAIEYVPTQEKALELARSELLAAPERPEPGDKISPYFTEEARQDLVNVIAESEVAFGRDISQKEIYTAIANLNRARWDFSQTAVTPVFPDRTPHEVKAINVGSDIYWDTAPLGKAVYLDGGYVDTTIHGQDLPYEEAITFETWVYPQGRPNRPKLFSTFQDWASTNYEWDFEWDFEEDMRVQWQEWLQTGAGDSSAEQVPMEQWTHVAVIWSPAEAEVVDDQREIIEYGEAVYFINGQKAGSTDIGSSSLDGGGTLTIGFRPEETEDSFIGGFNEFRIWDHARSEEQIQEYMDTELTGEEEGLFAYWDFNEILGQ